MSPEESERDMNEAAQGMNQQALIRIQLSSIH
jgi:hypothetical protein